MICSVASLSSSWTNLLDNGPDLSGNELCGVCTGVGNGVEGNLGGDDAGVLNIVVVVIFSKNASNWRKDNALCSVSNGRIGGTPPKPSKTTENGWKNSKFLCICEDEIECNDEKKKH